MDSRSVLESTDSRIYDDIVSMGRVWEVLPLIGAKQARVVSGYAVNEWTAQAEPNQHPVERNHDK